MKASQINTLKSAIKTELGRRDLGGATANFGSLAEYAGSNWDFTEVPATDSKIKLEHGKKTINALYTIKDVDNLSFVEKDGKIPTDDKFLTLEQFVLNLSAETMTNTTSSCRGNCSGLCAGSCITGCSGCNTGCKGSCKGNCSTTCQGSCNTGLKK